MANAHGHGGARENSGGARVGAGRPPGRSPKDTGRPVGATDVTINPARVVSHVQKWKLAEMAVEYAEEALIGIVNLMRNAQSELVRFGAMKIGRGWMGMAGDGRGRYLGNRIRYISCVYRRVFS
jgi:hypothetical protein